MLPLQNMSVRHRDRSDVVRLYEPVSSGVGHAAIPTFAEPPSTSWCAPVRLRDDPAATDVAVYSTGGALPPLYSVVNDATLQHGADNDCGQFRCQHGLHA